MFHLHIVGRRGHSYSISLISQWLALSIARRKDVRLTFSELPDSPKERVSAYPVFPEPYARVIDAIPDLAPGEVPDVEVRMSPWYKDPGDETHPKLLYLFAEARGPTALERLPDLETFNRRTNLGLLMPSNWVKKAFVEQGVNPTRMRDLGLGVDPAIYGPSDRLRDMVRQQIKLDGFAFLNVSGMWAAKGLIQLFQAATMLSTEGHKFRLILKGNDTVYNSKRQLRDLLAAFSPATQTLLARHITYIGHEMSMLEMSGLYNAADAYVSPYWAEGFNMPVLEAIACGVPVLCTAGGSTDDFTSHDVARHIRATEVAMPTGVVLQPDPHDLAQHMRDVMADASFRRSVRTAGPRHVANGHTWDILAGRLVELAREWSTTVRTGA